LLLISDDAGVAEVGSLTPETLKKMADLSEGLAHYLHHAFDDQDEDEARQKMMWVANLIKKYPEALGALSTRIYELLGRSYISSHLLEEKWGSWPNVLEMLLDQSLRRSQEDGEKDACDQVVDNIILYTPANRLACVVVADEAADRLAEVCTSACAAVCG
jgi:hypothetical protein